jgi:uncharacterized membrane protein YfcA
MELGVLMHTALLGTWLGKISTRLGAWVIGDLLFIAAVFSLPDMSRPAGDLFLVAHVFGICIATIVMFTGIGAGVLWFPFFTLMGCSPTEGVSLSLFTQIAGKGSGSIQYIRDNMVDWRIVKCFVPYALFGVTAGYMAGFVLSRRFENWLLLVFALVVLYLVYVMVRSLGERPNDSTTDIDFVALKKSGWVVQVSSFFTGLLSIGNSDWLIPYMERRIKVPDSRAVATGVFIMFTVALFFVILTVGGVLLGIRGWPNYMPILLATCSGVILGGQIGCRLIKIDFLKNHQRHVFVVILFLSAIHMIFEFFYHY